MTPRPTLRGQPLAVLLGVIACWVGLRAMTWEVPHWSGDENNSDLAVTDTSTLAGGRPERSEDDRNRGFGRGPVSVAATGYPGDSLPAYWDFAPRAGLFDRSYAVQPMLQPVVFQMASPYVGSDDRPLAAAGHQLMWMAALAKATLPQELAAYIGQTSQDGAFQAALGGQSVPAPTAPIPMSPGLASNKHDRWSADLWTFMRKEALSAPGSAWPRYGGSQAGAVLRYYFDPENRRRPLAYLRATTALGTVSESEVALGLGIRPLPSVPVTVAGEARAYRSLGQTSFRPAALAYTELAPFPLPLGFLGEAYVQGGYVGGKFATGFVDGQFRADTAVLDFAGAKVRAGAGLWGGAQKGVSRLDAGPGVSAQFDLAGAPSRMSMDYRYRLLGNAKPDSGPTVTISAGF